MPAGQKGDAGEALGVPERDVACRQRLANVQFPAGVLQHQVGEELVVAQEVRAQATRDAEKIAQDVRSRAETEATEIRMKAQAEASKQMEAALADANKQIADLAILATEKLLGRELANKSDQQRFVAEFLASAGSKGK